MSSLANLALSAGERPSATRPQAGAPSRRRGAAAVPAARRRRAGRRGRERARPRASRDPARCSRAGRRRTGSTRRRRRGQPAVEESLGVEPLRLGVEPRVAVRHPLRGVHARARLETSAARERVLAEHVTDDDPARRAQSHRLLEARGRVRQPVEVGGRRCRFAEQVDLRAKPSQDVRRLGDREQAPGEPLPDRLVTGDAERHRLVARPGGSRAVRRGEIGEDRVGTVVEPRFDGRVEPLERPAPPRPERERESRREAKGGVRASIEAPAALARSPRRSPRVRRRPPHRRRRRASRFARDLPSRATRPRRRRPAIRRSRDRCARERARRSARAVSPRGRFSRCAAGRDGRPRARRGRLRRRRADRVRR